MKSLPVLIFSFLIPILANAQEAPSAPGLDRGVHTLLFFPSTGQFYGNTSLLLQGNNYLTDTSNDPSASNTATRKYSNAEVDLDFNILYGIAPKIALGVGVGVGASGTENSEYSDTAGTDATNKKEAATSNSGLRSPSLLANVRLMEQEHNDIDLDLRASAKPKLLKAKRSFSYDDDGDGKDETAARGNVADFGSSYLLNLRAGKRFSEKFEGFFGVGWRYFDVGEFDFLKADANRNDVNVQLDPYSVFEFDFMGQIYVTKEVFGLVGMNLALVPETNSKFTSGANFVEVKNAKYGQVGLTIGAKYKASDRSSVSATLTGKSQGEYESETYINGVKSTNVVKNKSNFYSIFGIVAEFTF
jgi:hypothetical protein